MSGFAPVDELRRRQAIAERRDANRRQSSNIESAVLLSEMVRAHLKTICFCSVRKICELVLSYARQHLRAESPHLASLLGAYRGGLTPAERRRIERQLYDGTLRGVTATSSLELGVDIADLDGVVMNGFPGSLASLWQRAGRCGRTPDADALVILVAYPSAIDQWVMRHPEQTLARPVEPSIVDVANPVVLAQHLLCAAKEQPLTPDDVAFFGTCAAKEQPLTPDDVAFFGTATGAAAEVAGEVAAGWLRYEAAILDLYAKGKLQPIPPPAAQPPPAAPAQPRRRSGAARVPPRVSVDSWRCDVLIERPAELVNIRSIDQDRVQVLMRTSQRRTQPTIWEALGAGAGGAGGVHAALDQEAVVPNMDEEVVVVDEVERLRCWCEPSRATRGRRARAARDARVMHSPRPRRTHTACTRRTRTPHAHASRARRTRTPHAHGARAHRTRTPHAHVARTRRARCGRRPTDGAGHAAGTSCTRAPST